MSYPDPSPPPRSFMSQPYSDDNAGGFRPQDQMNSEYLDSSSRFEQSSPFKGPRISENIPRMNPPIPLVNKGTTHIFYKTRMCPKFKEGNCKNGDGCTFAHGPEDLREPPPNWKEVVKNTGPGNRNDDQKPMYKRICKFGEECPYGQRCFYRHESPSKFRTTDMVGEMAMGTRQSNMSIGAVGAMEHRSLDNRYVNKHLHSNSDVIQVKVNANSDNFRVNENANSDVSRVNMNANSDALRATMKNAHWKTKICTKWQVGICRSGERCPYAHGQLDLQVPNKHPNQPREFMMNENRRSDSREVMMNAVGSVAPNPFAVAAPPNPSVVAAPPNPSAVAARYKESGRGEKGFANWNPNKKINRIYGDWIDDLSPPRSQDDN